MAILCSSGSSAPLRSSRGPFIAKPAVLAATLLALSALSVVPHPSSFKEYAVMAPDSRAKALDAELRSAPPTDRTASLKLWLGRTLLELGQKSDAARTLDDRDLVAGPLREYAWKWDYDAISGDPSRKSLARELLLKLFSAGGEPAFRLEAARELAGEALAEKRWNDALPPLEALLKASSLDCALAAQLADACEHAGAKDRAGQLARWLYTEMPARPETRAFFAAPPARASYVAGLTREERLRRLIRLDAANALDPLAAELGPWSAYLGKAPSEAEKNWQRLFAARLEEKAGRVRGAVNSLMALSGIQDVSEIALLRAASIIPSAGLSKSELEKAVRALSSLPAGSESREKAFLALWKWRIKQADAAGAEYFALKVLEGGRENKDASAFLYRQAWDKKLSGQAAGAYNLFRGLVAALPETNETHQAALYTLLRTEGLDRAEAEAAKRELLERSKYGYFGYRLRGLGRPVSSKQSLPLPELPAPRPGTRVCKSLLLDEIAMYAEAEGELAMAAGAEGSPDILWALSQEAAKAGDLPKSIVSARKAFPDSFGQPGDLLPPEVFKAFYPLENADAIEAAGRDTGLPPLFLASVIRQESLWDREAVSHSGAVGLMQLMPYTAREVARKSGLLPPTPERLKDPAWNISAGARYLKQVVERSSGRYDLALASYNAGPGNVDKWLGRPGSPKEPDLFIESIPFSETRQYIRRIALNYWEYRRMYPALAEPREAQW